MEKDYDMAKYKKQDMSKKTLCELVKKGSHRDHTQEYIALVKKAKYLCDKCGRPAAHKKNVCKPVKI